MKGAACIYANASSLLIAVVKKQDGYYYEKFEKGIPTGGLKHVAHEDWGKTGDSVVDSITPGLDPGHGLIIRFYPDKEIFETVEFSYQVTNTFASCP